MRVGADGGIVVASSSFDACGVPTIAADGSIYVVCASQLLGMDPDLGVEWQLGIDPNDSLNGAPILGQSGTIDYVAVSTENDGATDTVVRAFQ